MGTIGVMTGILVALLGLDPLRVPGPISLLGFVLDAGVLTGVVATVWYGMHFVTNTVNDALEIQNVKRKLVIARGLTKHDFDQVRKSIKGWNVLLVRYGTEDYLRAMAGEGDRTIGRPRFSTSPMSLSLSGNGEVILNFSLSIHRRLGTQFRCFIETRGESTGPSVLTGMLRHYDEIDIIEPEVENPTRIYFLLRRYATITTADGIKQNFVHPE
jgi:hypothetical protein